MTDQKKNPAAVALGALGGKVKSKAKAQASASNGKLGGRPRKNTFLIKDKESGQVVTDPALETLGTKSKGVNFDSRQQCREWIADHKAAHWAVVQVVPLEKH